MTEISMLRSQSFLLLSLVRVGILCLYSVLLTGCVGVSNWLSGTAESQSSLFDTSHYFAPMQIGVTPAKEIVSRFGVPDDVQFGSIEGRQIESLGYSSNEQAISPFQYIPLFGAFEIWRKGFTHTPSAAISFSPEERASGLTVSSNNAYGHIRSPGISAHPGFSISIYGMRNPDVFYTANASSEHLP